jgi:hypothetical protein
MRRLHFWSNHLLEGKGMHTDCYLTLTCWLQYYKQQRVLTTKKGPHSGPLPMSYVQSYKDIWLQIHWVSHNVFTSWSTCLEDQFLFLVSYGHCFLWRTIHYNRIFGPLESTNIPKLTYFTMQHTQAQLLLRVDMGHCRPIEFSRISNISSIWWNKICTSYP